MTPQSVGTDSNSIQRRAGHQGKDARSIGWVGLCDWSADCFARLPCRLMNLQLFCNREAVLAVSTVRVANRRKGGQLVPATTRSTAGGLGATTRRTAGTSAGLGTSTGGTDTAPTRATRAGWWSAVPWTAGMESTRAAGAATDCTEAIYGPKARDRLSGHRGTADRPRDHRCPGRWWGRWGIGHSYR